MKQKTFWSDASRYGAIYGGVEILFLLLAALLRDAGLFATVINLFHISIFITLLYLFTMRRSRLYGAEEGYTYGNGLKYILALSLFAGILSGAYEIVARNWFFPELYREMSNTIVTTLAQTKLYTSAQLAEMKELYEQMLFSPLWIVVAQVVGLCFRGLFFGLFIAGFTKCEPDLFREEAGAEEINEHDDQK